MEDIKVKYNKLYLTNTNGYTTYIAHSSLLVSILLHHCLTNFLGART